MPTDPARPVEATCPKCGGLVVPDQMGLLFRCGCRQSPDAAPPSVPREPLPKCVCKDDGQGMPRYEAACPNELHASRAAVPVRPVEDELRVQLASADHQAWKNHELLLDAEADRARLQQALDEAVHQIPTDAPNDPSGRLLLNAYGRRCYNTGRDSALTDLRAQIAALEQEWRSQSEMDYGSQYSDGRAATFERCAKQLAALRTEKL